MRREGDGDGDGGEGCAILVRGVVALLDFDEVEDLDEIVPFRDGIFLLPDGEARGFLNLTTREGPVLVRKTLLAWLDEDGVTVVGTGRGKTVVVVEVDGDVRLTAEGGSLSGDGDGCRKGDERDLEREHHSEDIRRSDEDGRVCWTAETVSMLVLSLYSIHPSQE